MLEGQRMQNFLVEGGGSKVRYTMGSERFFVARRTLAPHTCLPKEIGTMYALRLPAANGGAGRMTKQR